MNADTRRALRRFATATARRIARASRAAFAYLRQHVWLRLWLWVRSVIVGGARLVTRARGRRASSPAPTALPASPEATGDGGAAAVEAPVGEAATVEAAEIERAESAQETVPRVEIERDDDIARIRAKLNQAPGPTVVLHVRRNDALSETLGMHLLKRHIDATRLLVIVDSGNHAIRRLAREDGLTVVGSMRGRHVEGGRLRSRYLRLGPIAIAVPLIGLLARWVVITAVLLGVLGTALVLVPGTVVRLSPELRPVIRTVTVVGQVVEEGGVLAPGAVRAQRYSTSVTAIDAIATSGSVAADIAAVVGLRFENLTSTATAIPADTRVTTEEGIAFRTVASLTLPAEQGAFLDVEGRAEIAGLTGNAAGGLITVVEEDLRGRVAVINPSAAGGGDTRQAAGADEEDAARLRRRTEAVLRSLGIDKIRVESAGVFVFHPSSAVIEIEEEDFQPAIGEPGERLELEASATLSVVGVPRTTLRALSEQVFAEEFAGEFRLVPGSLVARSFSPASYDAASETISFDMVVEGVITPVIEVAAIKDVVRRQRPGDAEDALNEQLRLRAPAEVDITPRLIPWTAPFSFRISVEVDTTLPGLATPPSDADGDLGVDGDSDIDGDADGETTELPADGAAEVEPDG